MLKDNLTIGLEIHAELKTRTKMFCDSLNDPDERHPNVNICPICVGHPGVLPTINKKAVEYVLKVGLALGGKLASKTKFDRKNYFYPDLPKGYQISQYDEPLVSGGDLLGIRIRRIPFEEDAGNLIHAEKDSLVDYNRAGVPLMELVTEPDITSAKQAVGFARELQLILRYLGVSDADMEKGQMRLEANVSIDMGTKVEVKNINSFKALGSAINYEYERQKDSLEKGKKIIQETRGWNDSKQATVSQRNKEEAQDYRYFPEPDLPPFDLSGFDLENLKMEIPELPLAKRKRFKEEFGLTVEQTDLLVADRAAADFFEKSVSELDAERRSFKINKQEGIRLLFNYFTSDLWGLIAQEEIRIEDVKITPENFADLIVLLSSKEISTRTAKDLLLKMLKTGADPHEIIKSENLGRVSDEELLKKAVEKILAENQPAVLDYKKGKANALQFLIGKTMAELGGRADPVVLRELFEKLLK
jgi:aspartyl-tRNA(Asn)/glutamyl-tRNA(Gln) amidotransferase subunit B